MWKATKVYVLSNGELVAIGDLVKVTVGEENQVIKVTDISEIHIAGEVIVDGESSGISFSEYFTNISNAFVVKWF